MDTEERLTIGILVGKEAQWLDQCLSQLDGFKVPIVVVGSDAEPAVTDICEKWNASYYLRPPSRAFSFAQQRQHLLKWCNTAWILMLDVDERIDRQSFAQAVRISKGAPDRAYVVRHSYMGPKGLLFVNHQPRLLPADGCMRFEGHVVNTLQAEHNSQEKLYPANIEIKDIGSVMDPMRFNLRRERYRQLSRWELKRLAALAVKGDSADLAQLGFRYFMMRRRRAADYFFKHLERLDPEHQEGQFYIARIEAQTNAAGEATALQRLWRLVKSGCRHYRIYQYLSRIHGRRGEHRNALTAAELGVTHHQQCAVMQHFLAVARYYSQDTSGATRALQATLRLWPGFAPAQFLQKKLIRH